MLLMVCLAVACENVHVNSVKYISLIYNVLYQQFRITCSSFGPMYAIMGSSFTQAQLTIL